MNISTIAALALSLGLPAWSQQPVTKIVRENGQPTLALDEGFVRGLKQESSIHKADGAPPPGPPPRRWREVPTSFPVKAG